MWKLTLTCRKIPDVETIITCITFSVISTMSGWLGCLIPLILLPLISGQLCTAIAKWVQV